MKTSIKHTAVVVAALSLTACTSAGATDEEAITAVTGMYAARTEAAARYAPERSLADLLPNRRFAVEGAPAQALAAGVVVGVVTDVEPGRAFVAPGEGGTSDEVAFDDESALWRTATLTFDVDERIGFEDPSPSVELTVPVDGSLDFDTFRRGVTAMGTTIAVLDATGTAGRYTVHWDGAFLAPVDEDGAFDFAGLGHEASIQGDLDTLDELRREAAKAPVVIGSDEGGNDRTGPTPRGYVDGGSLAGPSA